ncbi:hypothetical protein BDN70DRAFT_938695 [Pholiota conissans]|uniref:Uncharacterized protein n=1 Tax=Pholiota conissans TaxID=109636 RepID=A0A9P6CMH8_9AGAR|nr:hypothetical protein BDN70DRAFT_938695 [Pholiota conissans]
MPATTTPPPEIRTIYDETFRSRHYDEPTISSMATQANLLGRLKHHAATTDGSFSICISSGQGVFISKALLDSIPKDHRPALDTRRAGQAVETFSGTLISIGTTFLPVIFTNYTTGEKFRVVLYAIVMPSLYVPMFIGGSRGSVVQTTQYTNEGPKHGFGFGPGDEKVHVMGIY